MQYLFRVFSFKSFNWKNFQLFFNLANTVRDDIKNCNTCIAKYRYLFLLNLFSGNHDRNLNLDVSDIDVYFYDFPRNDVELFTIDDAADGILSFPELDKNKKFLIFVGGFKSQINKRTEEIVRDAFRSYPDSYIIMLDHSTYTHDRQGQIKSYERSVTYVHYIGKALANLLIKLREGGISPKNIHCIGHSLGGQILGNTGEIFLNNTGEKIARITALDPAGPCFQNSEIHHQVRSGLADYVEVYHCNSGGFGSSSLLGDVDFIINKNGESQPNCGTPWIPGIYDSSKAAKCSHNVCIKIWTATIRNADWYPARRCDSYKSFKKGECKNSDKAIAGFWNPGNATGVYYASTEGYNYETS